MSESTRNRKKLSKSKKKRNNSVAQQQTKTLKTASNVQSEKNQENEKQSKAQVIMEAIHKFLFYTMMTVACIWFMRNRIIPLVMRLAPEGAEPRKLRQKEVNTFYNAYENNSLFVSIMVV